MAKFVEPRELLGSTPSGAIFSKCRSYRYILWRCWNAKAKNKRIMNFVGLNPSTADAFKSDPTVTRCIRLAQREDCDAMFMLNLFAFRSTDPRGLNREIKAGRDPIGPHNNDYLQNVIGCSGTVTIACWGSHTLSRQRASHVVVLPIGNLRIGNLLFCLGTNADGQPKHPLYLRKDVGIQPYDARKLLQMPS